MVEEWKVIEGSRLEISSFGRARSCRGILKPQRDGGGYLYVRAYSPRRNIKIHIALCETFHGPKPFPEAMSLHKDDNKDNNIPSNVYWGTRDDNTLDMLRNNNKYKRGNDFSGQKNPNSHTNRMKRYG